MGKKKKNWRRQINPEKSNKMIIAVGSGLLLLFALFIFLTIGGGGSENKEETMSDTLDYLRKTPGITDVRITPEHNRVNILYDSHDKKDFRKIAKYAGLKLSYQLKSETFEIQLENENDKTPEYSVMVKNGQVIRENRVSRRKPD